MEAKSGGAVQLEAPVHTVVAANGGKLNITAGTMHPPDSSGATVKRPCSIGGKKSTPGVSSWWMFDALLLCVRSLTED